MDTSDPAIRFDQTGVCDHCNRFRRDVLPQLEANRKQCARIDLLVRQVKAASQTKDYDCILGLSGGLDSSYMLHLLVQEFGLRPLVFHVDGGWNTDQAISNIRALVDRLGVELHTHVVDWDDMRDFQLALFKSGLPYLDIAQDHAFIAILYHLANERGIKYIMNGGNYATEGVRNPLEWLYYGTDMSLINDIRRRFCTRPLKNYPFSPILFHKVYLRYFRGVKVVKPLNWVPYSKEIAVKTLREEYGWQPYAQKHFESEFTKFFESYWLPTRFGFDTRRVQFSSLILTGEMTRDEALEKLRHPAYDPETIDEEFANVAHRLGISVNELRGYHEMPKKSYRDYKNQQWMFNLGARVLQMVGLERSIKR